MNGIHDMGGLHGFGAVDHDPDDPVFHSTWESRVFCITQVIDTTGIWNLDEHRHEIELMSTVDYLAGGYYGRWLFAMESLLHKKNILRHDEVERRIEENALDARSITQPVPEDRNWPLADEDKIRWGAWRHEISISPKHNEGDTVRVRNIHPAGHTRVTSYTRGKVGTIECVNAQAWVLPDTRAHHRGENLQAVYTVCFSAQELWGPQAEENNYLFIDLSEDHIEPIDEK